MESSTSTMSTVVGERDGNALGGLFQNIIIDLRAGANNWDDLLLKANKFHIQLKSTISSSTAFLDAFQKIADMATTTRGGTKEIGSALTRLCLRNRSVEAKLKSLTSSLLDSFILPLQDRVDEWKKIIVQIDKEHNKEIKRLKQFRKKHSSETRASSTFSNNTFRMKRHPRSKLKNDFPRIGSMYDVDKIIESMDNKEKYFMLEEVERNYVRRALIEERSHYCLFFNLLRPVIEEEISMLQEIIHLEEVLTTLSSLTNDPHILPASSENFLTSLQLNDTVPLDLIYSESYNSSSTVPNAMTHSRKSSISSMDSFNTLSTDSISFRHCKSLSQPNINPGFRPKSIASQDSGFLSHDYNIPNIGRLVIYNNKNKNAQTKDPGCSLNDKQELYSTQRIDSNVEKSTINYDGEYATSEPLFNNKTSASCQQPIYVNVLNSYASIRFQSEGSVTSTNQKNGSIEENNYKKPFVNVKVNDPKSNMTYTKPKPIPPPPPVRYSSKLSTKSTMDLTSTTETKNKRSTLIYVQNNKENSLEFPPPPPEAYMAIRQMDPTNKINNQENLCCRYSVPSSHLVFCDNQDCLKNFETSDCIKRQQSLHYGSQKYLNSSSSNAYAMLDQTVDDNTPWKQKEKRTFDQDAVCNHLTFDSRYHSSINLSDQ